MISGMIRLAVFVLCVQMLLWFAPSEGYEKYLRLLVNLLVLLQFIVPLSSFFLHASAGNLHAETERLTAGLEEALEGMEWEEVLEVGEEGNEEKKDLVEKREQKDFYSQSIEIEEVHTDIIEVP